MDSVSNFAVTAGPPFAAFMMGLYMASLWVVLMEIHKLSWVCTYMLDPRRAGKRFLKVYPNMKRVSLEYAPSRGV
jgi:hypothetical protein